MIIVKFVLTMRCLHKHDLCCRAVSVCLSVTFVCCIKTSYYISSNFFHRPIAIHSRFSVPNIKAMFRRRLPNGGAEWRRGYKNRDQYLVLVVVPLPWLRRQLGIHCRMNCETRISTVQPSDAT